MDSKAQLDGLYPELPGHAGLSHLQIDSCSVTLEQYRKLHSQSISDTTDYWAKQAARLVTWRQPWEKVCSGESLSPELSWFLGGELNVSENCLDRHVRAGNGNKVALIWQGEEDDQVRILTYSMLLDEVCRCANVFQKMGVEAGDRVVIYLPMLPELVIAMLASARLGAIHCVIFSGFSSSSLAEKMKDCRPKVLLTADAAFRGGRALPLKANADEALAECPEVGCCLVVRRSTRETSMKPGRDYWLHEEMHSDTIAPSCPPRAMASGAPLFLLYTSGSTGKPKGVIHSTGGYFTHVLHSCSWTFAPQGNDVFWCTADVGWITGHSYLVYGPLGLGATVLMFEGIPVYPSPERYWQVIDKFRVSILYTAPAVIRALMPFGPQLPAKWRLDSLRLLATVGEPINTEAWWWYHQHVGRGRLPILDTWWQTETGGIMLAPLGCSPEKKPGAAAYPLPGVKVAILGEDGLEVLPGHCGRLVVTLPWPGMMIGLWGEAAGQVERYFPFASSCFDSGDGGFVDEEGCFWVTGRMDDVINVSGHRLGTAELEAALLTHRDVQEAAVVGRPHPVKGQAVYAFIVLNRGVEQSPELLEELRIHVRRTIGPVATPDDLQFAKALPKTRSGKMMRRLLKRIAAGQGDNLGDVSTLANHRVIPELVQGQGLNHKTQSQD